MKKIVMSLVALGIVFGVHLAIAALPQVPKDVADRANRYNQMAEQKISEGQVTDGVKLIRLAIQTNPLDPKFRMHYARIMSKRGELSLQSGNRREAIVVFKNVEVELLSAAKIYMDSGIYRAASDLLRQVGDIHQYVFRNMTSAAGYYAKAEELAGEHKYGG